MCPRPHSQGVTEQKFEPRPAFLTAVKCSFPLHRQARTVPSPHIHTHTIITQRYIQSHTYIGWYGFSLSGTHTPARMVCFQLCNVTDSPKVPFAQLHINSRVWSHAHTCTRAHTRTHTHTHTRLGSLKVLPSPALAPGIELISNCYFSGLNAEGRGVDKGIYPHFLPSCQPSILLRAGGLAEASALLSGWAKGPPDWAAG